MGHKYHYFTLLLESFDAFVVNTVSDLGVYSGERVIEYVNIGISIDSSSKGDTGFLTTGYIYTSLTDHSFSTIAHPGNILI
jgi:hypothetical protein